MKFYKRIVCLSVCALFAAGGFTGSASAQGRDRVVKSTSSQPTNLPPAQTPVLVVKPIAAARPVLTNDVRVVNSSNPAYEPPMVKKTGSSAAVNSVAAMAAAGRTAYGAAVSLKMDQAIKERYGLPYHYGSEGPYSYDCSGLVWSVFQEAGINFERTSAASIWSRSIPVDGDERFKFGTLVFFNGLGHIGIVADENGFYQASSSHGITYTPFAGYWENRIVGFRRFVPTAQITK